MTTTIYQFAQNKMSEIVTVLLELSEVTKNFTQPDISIWSDESKAEALLCGKGYSIEAIKEFPSKENAWLGRCAVPFSIELAATGALYKKIEIFTDDLINYAYSETKNFTEIDADWVYNNPHCLPVFMHVAGVFSKQGLQKQIGSASDNKISKPASIKIAQMLTSAQSNIPPITSVQQRIKGTVEGIVRDLVGRLLLEEFVASALTRHDVPFKREEEYKSLEGVVYDFRADFVVPDEQSPKAFLEVRKSSSRHASLYAKDKMFSAINWKGKHPDCLAVLIIDGPWTEVTLKIMSQIFDYVIPINQVDEVAAKIKQYLDGDKSVLQWLIYFKILQNRIDSEPVEAEKIQISGGIEEMENTSI